MNKRRAAEQKVALKSDVQDERPIALDSRLAPFAEIGASLGERALGNQIFRTRGAVIADFNGDGRLDLFLPQSGQTVGFTTDAHKVLTQNPLPKKPCVLYLNQGNDQDGHPILKSVEELEETGNGKNLEGELLIENKYKPRKSLKDDEFAIGRMSTGAVAADFNGDGRLDLWVTDDLAGLPFTTEETALKGYPPLATSGATRRRARSPSACRSSCATRSSTVATSRSTTRGRRSGRGATRCFSTWATPMATASPSGRTSPKRRESRPRAAAPRSRWRSPMSISTGISTCWSPTIKIPTSTASGCGASAAIRTSCGSTSSPRPASSPSRTRAQAWGVSGLIAKDGRKASMYFPSEKREEPIAAQTVDGKPAGEVADHSWSSIFTDENLDGYPDLIVSTDEGDRLRVYTNDHGKRFVRDPRFDADQWDGCWMGAAAGDLDGDGREEVFVSNCGGQSMSAGNLGLLNKSAADESILALAPLDYALGKARLAHALLEPTPSGYVNIADAITVNHSPYIAPDLTRRENFAPSAIALYDQHNYAHGLAAYEFAYAAQMLDVDDDGDLDLYFAGALARGNDGFIGDWTSSPGRLLVNDTQAPGHIVLTDRTLAYQVLDMTDMDYAHNPPRRKSPGTNWHKRDFVNVQDMDSYAEAGLAASQHSLIHDLFFMHEAANGIATGDLNGDGYDDFVVTHYGGYNSLSPQAGNLKADVGGILLAIPAPNKVMKPPTNFDEGKTFVYLNQNAGKLKNHFIKVRLTDEKSLNTRAIGARLVANGKIARTVRAGGARARPARPT